MTERERLHLLIEKLPERDVHTALRFLEYLESTGSDPVLSALDKAPVDDEPLSAEDVQALEEAEEDRRQGRVVSHEEARRRLSGEP